MGVGSNAALGLFALDLPATSFAAKQALMVAAGDAERNWTQAPASLPKGMMISILTGNPEKAGPFTLRLRMPPDTTIAPNTYSKDENVTVLAGSIVHETGRSLIRAEGMTLGAGGLVYLPAEMPHSLWTKSGGAEIQVTGCGPFGVTYVNPADNPGRASK